MNMTSEILDPFGAPYQVVEQGKSRSLTLLDIAMGALSAPASEDEPITSIVKRARILDALAHGENVDWKPEAIAMLREKLTTHLRKQPPTMLLRALEMTGGVDV